MNHENADFIITNKINVNLFIQNTFTSNVVQFLESTVLSAKLGIMKPSRLPHLCKHQTKGTVTLIKKAYYSFQHATFANNKHASFQHATRCYKHGAGNI